MIDDNEIDEGSKDKEWNLAELNVDLAIKFQSLTDVKNKFSSGQIRLEKYNSDLNILNREIQSIHKSIIKLLQSKMRDGS
jgi:hypothetical protein